MAQDDRPWYRRPGWYVSALLHGGVIALTLISIPSSTELAPTEQFVPVEMLQVADTTNVADKTKADKPKPDPKPAAKPDPKPKAAPTPTPPKPKPEPKPEPTPAPPPPQDIAKADPDPTPRKPQPTPPPPKPQPAAEPTPAPTPTPRAKPKDITPPPEDVASAEPDPKPTPKPDKPKPDKPKDPEKQPDKDKEPEKKPNFQPFDIDAAVAGLEDKEKKDDTSKDAPEEQPAADEKPQKGKGDQTKQTMAIIDAFKTQISKCWTPPAGAPDAGKIVVVIDIKLNRDGSLNGMPEYRDSEKLSDPYYRAAAKSARRAIMGCQNYTLPADAYDQWSELTLNFNPAEMLGL